MYFCEELGSLNPVLPPLNVCHFPWVTYTLLPPAHIEPMLPLAF